MKTLLLTASAALLLSCNFKNEPPITINLNSKLSNKPVRTQQHQMEFDEIKVSESINAQIVKSDTEKVVITAPADILDDVVVENKGGELHIHFKPGLNLSTRNVAAKIFARDFSKVEATSSARITIKDKFTQDRTKVEVSSSAEISGDLEANDLSIDASSSGSFSGKVWAVNLEADADSSGTIDISGKTKTADFSASSSGRLAAGKLIAEIAEIEVSSGGMVNVGVSDILKADASSGGNIEVSKKGNLQITRQNESSGGGISIR